SICCGRPLARQTYREFGERAGFAVDLDRAAMLLGDDVVADRQTESCPFAGRLGREEWLEQLVANVRRDAGPVVAHPYFDSLAEIARRDRQYRAEVWTLAIALPLGGGIEAVAE